MRVSLTISATPAPALSFGARARHALPRACSGILKPGMILGVEESQIHVQQDPFTRITADRRESFG